MAYPVPPWWDADAEADEIEGEWLYGGLYYHYLMPLSLTDFTPKEPNQHGLLYQYTQNSERLDQLRTWECCMLTNKDTVVYTSGMYGGIGVRLLDVIWKYWYPRRWRPGGWDIDARLLSFFSGTVNVSAIDAHHSLLMDEVAEGRLLQSSGGLRSLVDLVRTHQALLKRTKEVEPEIQGPDRHSLDDLSLKGRFKLRKGVDRSFLWVHRAEWGWDSSVKLVVKSGALDDLGLVEDIEEAHRQGYGPKNAVHWLEEVMVGEEKWVVMGMHLERAMTAIIKGSGYEERLRANAPLSNYYREEFFVNQPLLSERPLREVVSSSGTESHKPVPFTSE